MSRNGSGVYTAPSSTFNPAVPQTPIQSADWNALLSDLSLALTQSIASDGQTATSVRIPFSQGISLSAGTLVSPSVYFIGDTDTGFYSPAANNISIISGGVVRVAISETTMTLSGNLSAQSTSVAGNLQVLGNTQIGDTSGDTLTVNATSTFAGPATFNGVNNFVGAVTLPNDTVTNAMLANMATQTIKGRTTAGTGDPEDLTATQATAILNAVVGDSGSGGTKGLVPAPPSGSAAQGRYLSASGSFTTEIKAFAKITAPTTVTAGRNVASVANPGVGQYDITFSTALANGDYTISALANNAVTAFARVSAQSSSGFTVNFANNVGGVDPTGFYIQVIGVA